MQLALWLVNRIGLDAEPCLLFVRVSSMETSPCMWNALHGAADAAVAHCSGLLTRRPCQGN